MKAKFLHLIISLFFILSVFHGFPQFIDWQGMLKRAEVKNESFSGTNSGKVLTDIVHSPGLVGNILKDSPNRKISIYLPPGYDTNLDTHYPVLYLYLGYGGLVTDWFDYLYINKDLDYLINNREINPFIVVCPDNYTSYIGSWFSNSSLSGNWEDFNVKDVVEYVDNNYRTIPKPESRGISGWSMGGHGAVKFALKHPDVFGFLYSISGALLDFKQRLMIDEKWGLVRVANLTKLPYQNEYDFVYFSMAIAFAPNKNALGYGELPYTKNGGLIDSTWVKWLKQDPVAQIPAYIENPKKLGGIVLEFGSEKLEELIVHENLSFSKILTENGIVHTIRQHNGDHGYTVLNRMGSHVLPYFGNNLHSPVSKLRCTECLSNNDTLKTEFDIEGTLYVVPYEAAIEASEIISEKITSAEAKAFSEVKIPLTDYREGIYRIVGISKEGYISSPVNFSVVNNTPKATFRVTDLMTGEPIPNCTVNINDELFQPDKEGNVFVQGCGEHALNISFENYYTLDSTVNIFTDTTFAITLVKDSWVKVVDKATGEPIPDAMLTQMDKARNSDLNGLARVQNLRDNQLIYRIFKSNYFTLVDTIFLSPGDTAVIGITRKQAVVQFLIQDETGPIVNQLFQFSGSVQATNQEGIVTFNNVPARTKHQFNIDNTCYIPMIDTVYVETDSIFHITLEPETIVPEFNVVKLGGDSLNITGSINGNVFLVPEGTTMHPDSIRTNQILTVSLTANIPVNMYLDNLPAGETYMIVYLVETCQNISKWSPIVVSANDLNTMHFMIFPNPARDNITIETFGNQEYYVELSDMKGTVVYSSKTDKNLHLINLSGMSSGIYLITMKSKNITSVSKIIKL